MKNKKILGALAALCMGIILCVSSVFAINYWYTITNSSANNTVTAGTAIELSTTDTAATGSNLYPGGVVQFEEITVVAPQWPSDYAAQYTTDADPVTGDAINVAKPTFNLEVTSLTDDSNFAGQFKVYIKTDKVSDWTLVNTLADNLVLVEDVQHYHTSTTFKVQIRIQMDNETPASFAEDTLTFQVGLVAYDGAGVEIPAGTTTGSGTVLDATDADLFA